MLIEDTILTTGPTYIYAREPDALKNWLISCKGEAEIIHNLEVLNEVPQLEDSIIFLHKSDEVNDSLIKGLSQQGAKILLFSNKPETQEGLHYFSLGIRGYLNTFANQERIHQAMETINQGHIWLGQNIMQAMIQGLTTPSTLVNESWRDILTEREIEVVEQVIDGHSNKEIARILDITERTVKAHLQHIFQKFETKDRLSLAMKIKNWGND
ncbi:response regulator transcription factor [Thiomicrorhabdus sp. zzn3]|uniref:helix-turn-helix transcriptional regulator n=1 Tax=Thiomicrorhabdus sp. zzn3 TaxID=3039775 RepID=UPI0024370BE8|nr:response regulator transcription factor [Thiomicrorhabdus sp. zzn3]MDG6778956.1 response regulator transcription factor [Thiomicrorhabdus sp. zzn3]